MYNYMRLDIFSEDCHKLFFYFLDFEPRHLQID
jgi:hypothetical protein